MADLSLVQDDNLDDSDEGVFEQGDGPSTGEVGDDALPPLHRIKKYAYSENSYNRQMVSRVLLELFKVGPAEGLAADLSLIMAIIAKLAEDDETIVRTDVLEQIPNLAALAAECSSRVPALSNIVSEHLLPVVVRNLGTSDNEVRKTAHTTLFALMEQGLVTKAQAEIQVCPTVLAISRKECLMYYHTGAVTLMSNPYGLQLMSKMAPLLGRDVTERVFIDRFSELCSNQMFYVRKVCASHFGDFCAVVGKDAYEKILLPAYIKLSEDEIWGVRKACADVATLVSCACPASIRKTVLAPVFTNLLQDDSRWVRISAFQTLGPFISTFADPVITSLAYNNMGELVLVNTDGSEFKINNPSMPTSSDEIKHLFGLSLYDVNDAVDEYFDDKNEPKVENLSSKIEDPHIVKETISDEQQLYEDKVQNLMHNFFEDEDTVTTHQEQKDDLILQKNFDIVSKNMYGEVLENLECNKENVLEDGFPQHTLEEALQAMDALFDVKSFNKPRRRKNQPPHGSKIDEPNVIDENKLCDNLDSDNLNTITQDLEDLEISTNMVDEPQPEPLHNVDLSKSDETSVAVADAVTNEEVKSGADNNACLPGGDGDAKTSIEGKDEDTLDLYNSYNYWYVPPDMIALYPEIVDAGVSPFLSPKKTAKTIRTVNTIQRVEFDNGTFILNNSYLQEKREETPKLVLFELKEPSQHIVPQLLVDYFIAMTTPAIALSTNETIAYHCAYSLPAVALTLGSNNWHLLKDAVEILAANMQYKVRRTVASSLHELALILGPDIATSNLTPIFDGFIKDLDEVRIGVLKHLAHFLRLISPSKRRGYLPRLSYFLQTDHELNWRFRQELAEQLLLAVTLFSPADASKHITVIAQRLLCDKVSAVRQVALQLLAELFRHISGEPGLTPRLLFKFAETFAHSKKWKFRQTFVLLSSELLTGRALPMDQFSAEVMPHLLDLSWDPVANVRLVVARTIATQIITNDYLYYDGLQTVLRRLQADKDRDVRQSALCGTFT